MTTVAAGTGGGGQAVCDAVAAEHHDWVGLSLADPSLVELSAASTACCVMWR